MLLEGGASVDAVDAMGYTALHNAAFKNQVAVVRMLLEGGACVKLAVRCAVAAPHGTPELPAAAILQLSARQRTPQSQHC